jgi:DNA polymerase III subunit delta'
MYFKDVVGQLALKRQLIQNIHNGRVSHAQLFLGPEGSGKLSLAIAYARYLACINPMPDDACGICPSCTKFNKLAHPDLNFFYPVPARTEGGKSLASKDFIPQWRSFIEQSNYMSLNGWHSFIDIENKQGIISAEDCNEIIRVLGYKAYESEYKIVIIWMIERLYHSAAPKLLKILEEPPEKTLFLLVSENQDQILSTILSRAQLVKVPRLSDEEIEQGLVEKYNCDFGKAKQIAFIAEGNFLKAITLKNNPDIYEDSLVFLRDWLRACFAFNITVIMGYVDDLAKMGREKQKSLLSYGLEIFRQCILVNYHANQLMKVDGEARDFISKFSTVLKPTIAQQITDEFSSAIYAVERNANPKILFTDLSLKTARLLKTGK